MTNEKSNSHEKKDSATLSHEEYKAAVERRQRVRWLSLPVLTVSVVSVSLIVKFGGVDEEKWWPLILVVLFGGIAGIQIILYFFPYLRPLRSMSLPDGTLVPPPSEPVSTERLYESNPIWIIYKLSAVLWIVLGVVFGSIAIGGGRWAIGMIVWLGVGAGIQLFIVWLIGKITIEVNHTYIKVGMGPFKSRTAIENIVSIRSSTVRPLRDFAGWGFRVKSDGTRGFIGNGNVGIEYTKKNGRRTVVSVSDPQRYVDYVRAIKASPDASNHA